MGCKKIQIKEVAQSFLGDIRQKVDCLPRKPLLVGFLATDRPDSEVYSGYTKSCCEEVGIRYELRTVDRLNLEEALDQASDDRSVDGIIVYYPIFNTARDAYLRGLINPRKDVEGLNQYWLQKLYANERFDDAGSTKKSILPCTPLAIIKLIEAAGWFAPTERPLAGKTITVFNRSEVVGRPLAFMLANDGAKVFSYDIDGLMIFDGQSEVESNVARSEALRQSDIVVTGVPSDKFDLVRADEIKPGALCLNFAMQKNFAADIETTAGCYIPRIGQMTIAMCLRNTLRLFENYSL